jgi:hypothetical protein
VVVLQTVPRKSMVTVVTAGTRRIPLLRVEGEIGEGKAA